MIHVELHLRKLQMQIVVADSTSGSLESGLQTAGLANSGQLSSPTPCAVRAKHNNLIIQSQRGGRETWWGGGTQHPQWKAYLVKTQKEILVLPPKGLNHKIFNCN